MESWRLLGKKCVGLPERNREGEKERVAGEKNGKIIIEFLCCSQKKGGRGA